MGYYMRYFLTDGKPLGLSGLATGLQETDAAYSIRTVEGGDPLAGELLHGTDLYGLIEINQPPMAEEVDEMKEELQEIGSREAQAVMALLDQATATVVVQVLWQGREGEATLEKIDPLWEWLDANRAGFLQCDGEGYYRAGECILETG